MERIELVPYSRIYKAEKTLKKVRPRLEAGLFVLMVLGFFVSRATFLNQSLPFAFAFYTACLIKDKKYIPVSLAMAAGILLQINTLHISRLIFLEYMSGLAVLTIMGYVVKEKNTAVFASVAALMQFIILYSNFYKNMLTFDVIAAALSTALCFATTFVFNESIPSLTKYNRKILSKEEMIAVAVTAGIILYSLSDVKIASVSISMALCTIIVMILGYTGGIGVGSSVGLAMGFITTLNSISPPLISCYALSGLMAGLFNKLGKIGSALGFFCGYILMLLYMPSIGANLSIFEVITAAIILMVMPKSFINTVCLYVDRTVDKQKAIYDYNMRLKNITVERLKELSEILKDITQIMNKDSKSEVKDLSDMVYSIENKICVGCPGYKKCWQDHFYSTYKSILDRIQTIEYGTKANTKLNCKKINEINASINSMNNMYLFQKKWQKEAKDNKALIIQQFEEMSKILDLLSKDLYHDINFDSDMEDSIKIELDKAGFDIKDVYVINNKGSVSVQIEKKICYGKKECIKSILPILNRCTQKKMKLVNDKCCINDLNFCKLRFCEADNYTFVTGIMSNSKENVNGDNITYADLPDGKCLIALSDGMGTGLYAEKESKLTLKLIERFVRAGFAYDTVIKSVNKLLGLNSKDDVFATVDMCLFDKYSGDTDFIKMGSSATYVKKPEGVEIVRSAELPIGILDNVDVAKKNMKLDDEDILVMVTDGVVDSRYGCDRESLIKDMINDIDVKTPPQKIAKDIMDESVKLAGGKINDDMTVVVSKVLRL